MERVRRSGATTAMAAAVLLLSGCGVVMPLPSFTPSTHTHSAGPGGARAGTTSPTPKAVPVSKDSWLPSLVTPPLLSLWRRVSDKHTKIAFKLPHKPRTHTSTHTSSFGGKTVSWEYLDSDQLSPGHATIDVMVNPYVVTGAQYTPGDTYFSSSASHMSSSGYRQVQLTGVHSGTVKGHAAVFGTVTAFKVSTRHHCYIRLVMVSGPSWHLLIVTSVFTDKVSKTDRKDTDRMLAYVLGGLDFGKAG